MNVPDAARLVAVGMALMGVVDPSWVTAERQPVPVEIVGADRGRVSDLRRQLERRLGSAVAFDSPRQAAALVVVGDPSRLRIGGAGTPISTVAERLASPNVRIVRAGDPAPVRVGWAAAVEATIEAHGLAGTASAIVLEVRGVEVARVEHKWKIDPERHTASLRYVPPSEGASTVTVRAIPLEREVTASDNAVDLRLVASRQRLKILVHETRPSWNTTFLRRALEDDPTFEVSAVARSSKSLAVRAGSPPPALTDWTLPDFAAVVVGAPEELREPEITALRAFAGRRGGAVVLVPDRRPTGAYLDLMPSAAFDEVLIDDAVALTSIEGGRLRASEMAISRGTGRPATVLASVEHGKVTRPVVVEWLLGAGRVLFSGALDAWRYRGADDEGFSRFWRARIAEAAMASPRGAELSIVPGAPRVGEEVAIRVQLRPTELSEAGGTTRTPPIGLAVDDEKGRVNGVRLWPTSEVGTFEGRFRFASAGDYTLHVAGGDYPRFRVIVGSEARRPVESTDRTNDALRMIAASTAGVAASESDLAPVERHLRGLPAGDVERAVYPWRSPWTVMTVIALLSIEWAMRRRRGDA